MSEALQNSTPSATNRWIRHCLLLVGVLLLAFPLFAYFGHSRHGQIGIIAAAVAAAICLVAGWLAIAATQVSLKLGQGLNGLLFSMLIRTGLPLIAGLILTNTNKPLADAGVFGMILLNYLLMLAIETTAAVQIVRENEATQTSQQTPSSPAANT